MPASRSAFSKSSGRHRVRAAADLAAPPDSRAHRRPARCGHAGVPARSRPVAASGCHHGGDEPSFQRPEVDVADSGSERHDELGTMASAVDVFRRSMIEARSMRETQEASEHQTELEAGPAAPDGRPLRGRRQERGRRSRAGDHRHAACGRRNHDKVTAFAARRRRGSRLRRGVRQRQRGCRRDRRGWRPLRRRSAVRSPIPARSPTTPWSRSDRPPKW